MHKKIKYIIAASLIICAASGVLPANNFILGSTKAYASSYDDDDYYYDDDEDYDKAYLENVELSEGKITHAHTSFLPRGSGVFRADYQQLFVKSLQSIGCNNISIEEKFDNETSMLEILLELRNLSSSTYSQKSLTT